MIGHIDPTKEIFKAFRDNNREGPIQMLNLVQLRAVAARKLSAGITASSRNIRMSRPSSI
jgi:hypothetical protein